MKHLKSSSRDLHRLFHRSVCVREIAEPLASFDIDRDPAVMRAFMEKANYDAVGLREDGQVTGYLRRAAINNGEFGNAVIQFTPDEVLDDGEPLSAAIELLSTK